MIVRAFRSTPSGATATSESFDRTRRAFRYAVAERSAGEAAALTAVARDRSVVLEGTVGTTQTLFRGLAATTNTSNRLRFGEVDCVRDRSVCSMLKADKQPLVRIYRHAEKQYTGPAKEGRLGFKREVIREWSGLLIGYEVVDWFKSLQTGPEPILDYDIAWPSPEELGLAMRRFKARGRTQHDSSLTRRSHRAPLWSRLDCPFART